MHINQMDLTKRDFLINIARMYYEQELSQQDIAAHFNISRSQVSKLLKLCKEEKIVEIRIQETTSKIFQLQHELRETFGLDDAVVTGSHADAETLKRNVARTGADYVQSILQSSMKIGISWGTTLYELVHALKPVEMEHIEIVQLHGGYGARNVHIDGHELANMLAAKVNGAYHVVQAPVIVSSKKMKDLLVQEPGIHESLSLAASVDTALTGIGSNAPEVSSLVRAGYLRKDEAAKLVEEGAVGVVCGFHVDRNGVFLNTSINERMVGIDVEAYKRIPRKIGVASGLRKAEAVLSALRGGFLNVLVIDEDTARRVILDNKT